MARCISLEPHLTIEEHEGRYRSTRDPVERSRWHFLWPLARGLAAKVITSLTGYSAYWIGRIAWRYNQRGPDGVKDLRHQSRPGTPLLSVSGQGELGRRCRPEERLRASAGAAGRSPPGSASVWADASVVNSAGCTCGAWARGCGCPARAM
jgi:hypothetical protein